MYIYVMLVKRENTQRANDTNNWCFHFCHSSLNRMLSHNRKMSFSQNFSFYESMFPLFLDMLRVLWSLFGVASYLWGNSTRGSGRFKMIFLFWDVSQWKFMLVWCESIWQKRQAFRESFLKTEIKAALTNNSIFVSYICSQNIYIFYIS